MTPTATQSIHTKRQAMCHDITVTQGLPAFTLPTKLWSALQEHINIAHSASVTPNIEQLSTHKNIRHRPIAKVINMPSSFLFHQQYADTPELTAQQQSLHAPKHTHQSADDPSPACYPTASPSTYRQAKPPNRLQH